MRCSPGTPHVLEPAVALSLGKFVQGRHSGAVLWPRCWCCRRSSASMAPYWSIASPSRGCWRLESHLGHPAPQLGAGCSGAGVDELDGGRVRSYLLDTGTEATLGVEPTLGTGTNSGHRTNSRRRTDSKHSPHFVFHWLRECVGIQRLPGPGGAAHSGLPLGGTAYDDFPKNG